MVKFKPRSPHLEGKNPDTDWIGGWVGPELPSHLEIWKKREIFRPCQNSSSGPSSPLRSHHTGCTTTAPLVRSDHKRDSEVLSFSTFSDLVTTDPNRFHVLSGSNAYWDSNYSVQDISTETRTRRVDTSLTFIEKIKCSSRGFILIWNILSVPAAQACTQNTASVSFCSRRLWEWFKVASDTRLPQTCYKGYKVFLQIMLLNPVQYNNRVRNCRQERFCLRQYTAILFLQVCSCMVTVSTYTCLKNFLA